ncbi:MAG: hypothetical protein ABIC91_08570 [Nanoarchaeota archaeon]|nr:hypothetical protein [Nanoarchaeota archaeon]MBU1030311.1 hypothetical protein [Nanoarchaeota archaeon]MBU1849324.1 hypothetical protein [Nanoarchaeota archaeon]
MTLDDLDSVNFDSNDSLEEWEKKHEQLHRQMVEEGRQLWLTDESAFYNKYCSDCTLGDHAGCRYCDYIPDDEK